jgi:hypothetical protein
MNKRFLLLFLLSVFSLPAWAQISNLKNYKWPDKPKQSPAHEKFSSGDAYIIHERQVFSLDLDSRGVYSYSSIKRKIKILTQKGVDEYARIVVPRSRQGNISLLDARTIKSNGQTVDLDVKEIKELTIADDEKLFDRRKFMLFAIPGVEAGDEVEIIIGYGGYGASLGEEIYLHSYLPIVKSEVSIHRMKDIILDVRFYNQIDYPKQEENSTHITYQWTMNDVPAMADHEGSIPTLDLPYISYVIKKVKLGASYYDIDGVGNTWVSAKEFFANQYLISGISARGRDRKLDNYFENLWTQSGATDKLSKVRVVHNHINNKMKVTKLPDSETSLPLINYLNNMAVDAPNLYRIYHYLLYSLATDYFFCMARDFYDGPIDLEFIACQQIDNLLFSFKDEKGETYYLIPRNADEIYEVGEIAGDLQGTKIVAIQLNRKDEISFPTLPYNTIDNNLRSRIIRTKITPGSEKSPMQFTETLQGIYSTNARHFYIENDKAGKLKSRFSATLKERNSNMELDSIRVLSYDSLFPFQFKFEYFMHTDHVLSEVDKNLYSINMNNWFHHILGKVNPEGRIMDYYFPFTGRDAFKYYLEFENEVEMVNSDKLVKNIVTPFSRYSLTMTQVSPKVLLIESTVTISKKRVPLEEINKLKTYYEHLDEADNEPLLVKLK